MAGVLVQVPALGALVPAGTGANGTNPLLGGAAGGGGDGLGGSWQDLTALRSQSARPQAAMSSRLVRDGQVGSKCIN